MGTAIEREPTTGGWARDGSGSQGGDEQTAKGISRRPSRGELVVLAAILIVGLILRMLLLPMPGYRGDILFFTNWANALNTNPWDHFYSVVRPACDYLPGYLYILAGTGYLERLISGGTSLSVQGFEPWIKAGTILSDLIIAGTAYLLCRRITGPRRSLAAAGLIALNPAMVFVGAIWGQVDSIAVVFSLLAVLALVSGRPTLAAVLAAIGFLVKPQYSLFLAIAGVAYLRHEIALLPDLRSKEAIATWARRTLRRVGLPIAALLATVEVLLLPFSVSIWRIRGVTWTLQDRINLASIRYPFASWGAYNLWDTTPIRASGRPDATPGWLSFSYQDWGYVLLAGVVVMAGVLAWRRPRDPVAVLWACFVAAFAFFEVTTRMHERYLFPAIPLIGVVAVLLWRTIPVYLGVTGFFLINVWSVWAAQQRRLFGSLNLTDLNLHYWDADFGALLFLICLVILAAMLVRSFRGKQT